MKNRNDDFLDVSVGARRKSERLELGEDVATRENVEIALGLNASKDVSHAPAAKLAVIEAFGGEKLLEERRIEEIKDGVREPEATNDGIEGVFGALENVDGFVDEGSDEGGKAKCRIDDGVLELQEKHEDLFLLEEGSVDDEIDESLKQTTRCLSNDLIL